MQAYIIFKALALSLALSTCFWLFYKHRVIVNNEIKIYDELNAPVTLMQGYFEVITFLFYFFFLSNSWMLD